MFIGPDLWLKQLELEFGAHIPPTSSTIHGYFHMIDLVEACTRSRHFGVIFEGKSFSGPHSWACAIESKI